MQCPSCKKIRLEPILMASELPAMACCRCGNAFLSILLYRQWIESHPVEATVFIEREKKVNITDCDPSLICPKCSTAMMAYKLSTSEETIIHICSWCYEVWVPAASWHLLRQLEVQRKFPGHFFIPFNVYPFQETTLKRAGNHLAELLGSDYPDIKILKKWIDKHPQKSTILCFLSTHGSD